MYFPFFTCEVGAEAIQNADWKNTHSMTLAVRAIVELFRLVNRESELHLQILAFSISHDHQVVHIYGHYPVIDKVAAKIKYYRHPIRSYDFTDLNGRDKWTAYQFTLNLYDIWVPMHFKRVCSAVDQIQIQPELYNSSALGEIGVSQEIGSNQLAQSNANIASPGNEKPTTTVTSIPLSNNCKGAKKSQIGT